ncbi:HprK-related kinase B [Monaibacterium marinum]|uniref:HprK-related kinase B n=1 Tax=Pontivivens marinum TaxID=1690039 RepID=A0A2C9CLS0_9RHOB|nr:HprK-related kinase B [Monaibacterium marinum]SOH92223.1 HprK-related kinase B [Monaibacterium marinum]
MTTVQDIIAQLDLTPATTATPFHLRAGDIGMTVLCPQPLRTELTDYFAETLSDTAGQITVHLLPDQTLPNEPDWVEWARDAGKMGRKDAVADIDGARMIKKVRSGVTFVQSPEVAIAFGPLNENVSTVINFINTQILSTCLRDGWQLCHAAAIAGPTRSLAISGLSGGGKSTSVLKMMEHPDSRFVSNDRLLVRDGTPAQALGIPKHPRINPGTILGNPRLHAMLTPARRAELEAMPADDLWTLEDKYDLFIADIYGPNRMQLAAPLTDFWVLNWSRTATTPTTVTEVNLDRRPDLLSAIMKSPGAFHQHADGRFEPNGNTPTAAPFLDALRNVRVSEVSGRVDFDALSEIGRRLLDG